MNEISVRFTGKGLINRLGLLPSDLIRFVRVGLKAYQREFDKQVRNLDRLHEDQLLTALLNQLFAGPDKSLQRLRKGFDDSRRPIQAFLRRILSFGSIGVDSPRKPNVEDLKGRGYMIEIQPSAEGRS